MTLFFLAGTTGAGAILEGGLRAGGLRPYDDPLNIAGIELDGGTFPFVTLLTGEILPVPVLEGGVLESIPFLNLVTAVLINDGWEVNWASHEDVVAAPDLLDSPDNLHRADSTTHRAVFGRVDGAAVLEGSLVLNANATGGFADDLLAVGTRIFQTYRIPDVDSQGADSELLDIPVALEGEVAVAGALRSPPMVMFDTTNFLQRPGDDVSLARTGAYTISITLDPELIIPGNDGVVASKHNLTDTQAGWKIEYEVTAGLIRFTHYGAADGTISKSRTNLGGAAAVRVRSRVTFVIDTSGDIEVYVNGTQSQDTQTDVGVWVATNQSTEPFALGCDEPSNGGTNRYKGAIYDFTMWSTDITQSEAESLEPQGFLPGALTPNLVHYWDSQVLRASITLGQFRDWIDSENALPLLPGNPASALPIYVAAADSGLNPFAPPLPFTHDNNALLFDTAPPLPTTALTTLHRLDPLTKWRLWSANSLTPQVNGFFRRYRGDATITIVLARVDGANDIEICSIYGFRLQYASTSNVFLIDGDDAAPNNRLINFPGVSMPNGRDEPLEDVVLNSVVKVFTVRYNSYTGEIDFYDGTIRVAHRVISTGQAANETRTNLLAADFGDFRRMIFIPACLSNPQVESQLQKINPPGWFAAAEDEFGSREKYPYIGGVPYAKHAPEITPYRNLQGGGQGGDPLGNPVSVGVVEEEPNATLPTSTTTADGRLYYGDQRDGIVPSSVTIRMPQDGGPDMLYDDDGAGNLVAQGGAQPVASSDIAYINEPATGQVALSGIPADGNTVELIGVDQDPVTFEWESGGGVAAGNIPVTIGVDTDTSATNLRTAINENGFLRITASGAAGVVALTQFGGTTKKAVDGQLGNTVITVVGANLAKTDFTGGQRGGTWSLTITGAGLIFDVAVLPTAVYQWDSQGVNAVGTVIDFDNLEFIITQHFLVDEGATLDMFYVDAPYVIKDGFDEDDPGGGGTTFTDPLPTVVTVTADATFIVTAIANAGPTNAGDVISWWEIELETNNEELILVADYFQPNTFSINRNHTDQFPILQGQNLDEKRIRFVIQAVVDGAQFWKSLFFRMLGSEFDNDPPTVVQVPVAPPGGGFDPDDLLTTEELAALVLDEGVVPDVFLEATQPENSRYKTTQVFKNRFADRQGNELALMAVLPDFFQLGEDFNTYTVGARDVGFLDRVAVRFYGPGFEWAWWVLAYANAIIDVEQEMFSGQLLVVPTRTRLQSFLAKAAQTTLTPD